MIQQEFSIRQLRLISDSDPCKFDPFKREPRANSALPIHRFSKAISENIHGG